MDKIEAARHARGLIVLQTDTAEQIKRAIEKVSKITQIDDNKVAFEGHRIVEGHGFAKRVQCFDIFECPGGYLLHTYMEKGPNWAVTGKTLDELLAAAPDQSVARRAHGLLIQKNLVATHH